MEEEKQRLLQTLPAVFRWHQRVVGLKAGLRHAGARSDLGRKRQPRRLPTLLELLGSTSLPDTQPAKKQTLFHPPA